MREIAMWASLGSGAHWLREFNSKFQVISNKFKTVQTWFVPKKPFKLPP
jgi:hypothetical protein